MDSEGEKGFTVTVRLCERASGSQERGRFQEGEESDVRVVCQVRAQDPEVLLLLLPWSYFIFFFIFY